MSKIAEEIYEDAEYQQENNPECIINVGYAFKRNKHNLEEVKRIAESRKRRYAMSLQYGVISQEEYNKRIAVNNQIIKSVDYTIQNIL